MFVAAAVGADELHLRLLHADVEHTGVGGVGEVEADDLAETRVQCELRLAGDQQDVAESPHRGVCRFGAAERGHFPVLDEDVVQSEQDLAVNWRPVVDLVWDDKDVAVKPKLLAVVLTDVWVVPVHARIGELEVVGEVAANRDRRLGFVGSVIAVIQPQPVPMHGVGVVTLIRDVDGHP